MVISWLPALSVLGLPLRLSYLKESASLLAQPLTRRWQFDSDRLSALPPAANGTAIFLPLSNGELIALSAEEGQLRWRADIGGSLSAAPAADERAVYLASETSGATASASFSPSTGALRALSPATGVTLWMRTLPSPMRGGLALSHSTLFGGASDGRLYAISLESGEIRWTAQHETAFNSGPVLSGGRLYVVSADGVLQAIEQESGRTAWRYRTRRALNARPALAEGSLFFGSADGYVYALNEVDGRLRWKRKIGTAAQGVIRAGEGLVITSLDNFVQCLTLKRGERLWKRQLPGRAASPPVADGADVLLAPLGSDSLIVLSAHDGRQLNAIPVGEGNVTQAAPLVAGHSLLVTTRGSLVAFAPLPTGTR